MLVEFSGSAEAEPAMSGKSRSARRDWRKAPLAAQAALVVRGSDLTEGEENPESGIDPTRGRQMSGVEPRNASKRLRGLDTKGKERRLPGAIQVPKAKSGIVRQKGDPAPDSLGTMLVKKGSAGKRPRGQPDGRLAAKAASPTGPRVARESQGQQGR